VLKPHIRFEVPITEEWLQYNLAQKFMFLVLAPAVFRLRYYLVFNLGEISANLSGLSWNTETQESDLYRNVDWKQIEKNMNVKFRLLAWNKSAQKWLHRICYLRLLGSLGRTKAGAA
jgi:hypothetical protein